MSETEEIRVNLAGDLEVKSDANTAALRRMVQALDTLNERLDKVVGAAKGTGESVQKIKDPAEIARRSLEGLSSGLKGMVSALAAGDAKGAIEGTTEALAGLASALDVVVPGLGQVAAAGVKAAGALAGLVASGVETALEVTAMNAQLEATFDALGKGPDAGKRTIEMLDDVARVLPQSREELARWTREVEKMGVTDLGQVRRELLATASAQAILGEEGPAAFQKIERKIHDAIEGHHALKIASKELTRTIGTNLAGAAAERMGLTLEQLEVKLKAGTIDAAKFGDSLEEALIAKGGKGLNALWMSKAWSKIKESGRELFADVDITPITNAMRNLLGLFDQTQPSGQAMKTTLTDVFNGIVHAIGGAITEAEVFALTLEVYGLMGELALMPILNTIVAVDDALANTSSRLDRFLGQAEAKNAAGAPAAPQSPQDALAGNIVDTLGSVGKFVGLGSDQGQAIGLAIGLGLVNGLGLSDATVTAAANDLGQTAVRGTKAGAGVKSPSKPAIEIGGYVAEGLGIGMAGGGPGVARAGRQLSANALGGLVGSALTSPAANGNGGGGLTISGLTIHITAPQGVTGATELSATGLAVALERFQLASGR